ACGVFVGTESEVGGAKQCRAVVEARKAVGESQELFVARRKPAPESLLGGFDGALRSAHVALPAEVPIRSDANDLVLDDLDVVEQAVEVRHECFLSKCGMDGPQNGRERLSSPRGRG